jgi:phytoene/squalene synthetase
VTWGRDLTACAELVRRGDPDRFLAVMAAPVAARQRLFPLYAMNVEVSRAPWVTQEAMIAEMRLQWWRDALDEIATGASVRRHEVVTPLAELLTPAMAARLDGLIEARRWDIYRDPFEDRAGFDRYIDETAGTLMWAAASILGAADETVVRDFAYAAGLAGFLRATAELEARGRIPLLDGTQDGVRALARDGLDRLNRAQAARSKVSKSAAPALLSGWQARAVLAQTIKDPLAVAEGRLGQSEAGKRLALMARAATGRW